MTILNQIPNNFTEDWSQGFDKNWRMFKPGQATIIQDSGKNWLRISDNTTPIFEDYENGVSYYVYRFGPKFVIGTDADFTITASIRYNYDIASGDAGNYDAFVIYQGEQEYAGIYCAGSRGWFSYNLAGLPGSVDLHDMPAFVTGHEYQFKFEYEASTGTTRQYARDVTLGGNFVQVGTHITTWGGPVSLWISNYYSGSYWSTDIGQITINRKDVTCVAAGAYDYVPWFPRRTQYPEDVLWGTEEWDSSVFNNILYPWDQSLSNVSWTLDYHFDLSKTPGGLVPTYSMDFTNIWEAPYKNEFWDVLSPPIAKAENTYYWDKICLWGTQRYGYVKVKIYDNNGIIISDNEIAGNSLGFTPSDQHSATTIDLKNVTSDIIRVYVYGDWGETEQEQLTNFNLFNQSRGSNNPRLLPATLHGFQVTVTPPTIIGLNLITACAISDLNLIGITSSNNTIVSNQISPSSVYGIISNNDSHINISSTNIDLVGLLKSENENIDILNINSELVGLLKSENENIINIISDNDLIGFLVTNDILENIITDQPLLEGLISSSNILYPINLSTAAVDEKILYGPSSIRSPSRLIIARRASGELITIKRYISGMWQ